MTKKVREKEKDDRKGWVSVSLCKDTGYSGADGCQINREREVVTTTYSTLLVYLQIRTSIYRIYTQ